MSEEKKEETVSFDLENEKDLSQLLELAKALGVNVEDCFGECDEAEDGEESSCKCKDKDTENTHHCSNRSILWVLRGIKYELHHISTSLYIISKSISKKSVDKNDHLR